MHYPLMACVGEEHFQDYHSRHISRISAVVVPLMLIEATTAFLLVFSEQLPLVERCLGLLFIGTIWGSTFLLQVPQHQQLTRQSYPHAVAALVRFNWIRTLCWSARGGIVLLWIVRAL